MDITTVLLDFDNTLVLLDESAFAREYIEQINKHYFPEIELDHFFKTMLIATRAMGKNSGNSINIEVFLDSFNSMIDIPPSEVMDRFGDFYQSTVFMNLKSLTTPVEGLRDLFNYLKKQKLGIIIATNPFFPVLANKVRLSWMGINDLLPDDLFVTSADEFHSCKPHKSYYEEIVEKAGVDPEKCLMVGNNPQHDLPASLLGMKTYIITAQGGKSGVTTMFHVSNGDETVELKPDGTGENFTEFLEWFKSKQGN